MSRQPPRITGNSGPSAENPPPQTAPAAIQPGVAELLTAGLEHHQAGRLVEAEAHYQRILDVVPDHADVLHLLGGLAYQVGRHEVAIELIGRAIEHNGNDPSYYCTRGLVLQGLKRLDEAVASYDRALVLNRDYSTALINRGLALEALERFAEGLESYDRAIAIQPNSAEALLNRGNALQQLGRLAEALESYDRTLALRPDLAEGYYNRGDTLQNLRHLDEAVASYDRAVDLNPDFVEALLKRGNALQQLGRFAEALDSYDRALVLRPDDAVALLIRGNVVQQLGRFVEALESYDRVLGLRPDYAEALINRGNALQQLGRFAEALESYDRALALRRNWAPALNNRGNALQQLGHFTEALENYDRALALRPDYVEALCNRGNALQQLGRVTEGLESYDRALALRPDDATALIDRGLALQQLGRFAEALESYDRALALRPDDAVALFNRGTALRFQGKLNEAVVSFGQAAALRPDYAVAEWFNARQMICDWTNYREDEARARNAVKARISPFAPFALIALSSTPEEQLDCARQVAAGIAVRASALLPRRQPRPIERVRLGYLSADFRQHAVAILMAGLIEHHDRRRFEVVGYSYGSDDHSALRSRLEVAFDQFVDIRDMQHRQAAELIHTDAVDILIDLTGYTGNSRTEILAYRPAPVQINYLGYPGTMGADFIDYIIVDRFVVPTDQQAFFSERLVHLPGCYQCNDDKRAIPARTPSRAECGLPETGFVFCCFNNSYKITPAFFDIWMRLLAAVPDSVLWLSDPWAEGASAWMKANLAREAAARGVMPERLVFAPHLPLPEHLARHRLADLFLDTLPYNAHTTASDALWAGLPVLTCAGNTFAGRVAGSLLRAVGLGELVTTTLEDYEAMALRLARDVELLTRLRERLAQNRRTSPPFNTERYTSNLETAYWRMWETWKAGRPPAAFSVP